MRTYSILTSLTYFSISIYLATRKQHVLLKLIKTIQRTYWALWRFQKHIHKTFDGILYKAWLHTKFLWKQTSNRSATNL